MRALNSEALEFFASAPGLEALARAGSLSGGLAGLSALRKAGCDADQAAWALDQVKLRAKARAKFGAEAAEMLFLQEALEQASAQEVAGWRAARLARALDPGARVLEVGASLGGDTLALARAGLSVSAAELDPLRAALLRWNLRVAGCAEQVDVVEGDALARSWSGLRAVFADPARRAGGRRVLGLEQGSPSLSQLRALGCPELLVKAAPGLDLDEVPPELGLSFVSLGGELKEALLAGGALRAAFGADPGEGRAFLLSPGENVATGLVELRGPRELPARVAPPGAFVFEPDPALIRAGLIRRLGQDLDAWQLDPRIVFLSADAPTLGPCAGCYAVLERGPWRRKTLSAWVRAHGAGRVDVKQRGLRGDPGDVSAGLPTTKGGPALTLFLYQTDDGPQALLSTRVE